MAGHSKWANIKRTKGVKDAKRASQFTKLSKDITTAASIGGSMDPNFNPMLKVAIDKAKQQNMPSDKIQKAINKGSGKLEDSENVYYNTYEFFGPSDTTFIIDVETDNPNRSLTDLKIQTGKLGLKMANQGSVSWNYEEVGLILVETTEGTELEEVEMIIIDLPGIIDYSIINNKVEIFTTKNELKDALDIINKNKIFKIKTAEIIKKAKELKDISDTAQLEKVEEELSQNQDIVNIWKNYK